MDKILNQDSKKEDLVQIKKTSWFDMIIEKTLGAIKGFVEKRKKNVSSDKEKTPLDKDHLEKINQEKKNLLQDFFGLKKEEKKEELDNFDVLGDSQNLTKLSQSAKNKIIEAEKIYEDGLASIRDLIAPSYLESNLSYLRIGDKYVRSFYVFSYPRYIESNWLSPVVNYEISMDIAEFIYPIDSSKIMKILNRKVTQMSASLHMAQEKRIITDVGLSTALEDAEDLRMRLQRGEEKFFQFALYFTIYADDLKILEKASKRIESLLGGKLVLTKRADFQMEHAFNSTMPLGLDEVDCVRNMNTGPLSTTFPFSSSTLTSNSGVLYGINRHNDSLIVFDRFSLENANSVLFAKSGAGKSYAVKLEVLRSLMMGVDVIIIDPENEYQSLCEVAGGSYLKVSLNSDRRINPFDLPEGIKDDTLKPGDLLRASIINLQGLLKLMLGEITSAEDALLEKALIDVYAIKGMTMDKITYEGLEAPLMQDLHDVLKGMEGAENLATRLEKYSKGIFSGIFNAKTNVDLQSGLMVFSIRDLEDTLRPIAMYIVLNYIWNKVRSSMRRRILVIDEAWSLMQYEDSAKFLYGLVKRARKYWLGITTITQDVEDFMKSSFGKPIITNSSLQLLLKQSPSAMEVLTKAFNLTEGEKYLLLNSGVGQGLFFAGNQHAAIQIIASYNEDKIVTTRPEEVLANELSSRAFLEETAAKDQNESSGEESNKQEVKTEEKASLENRLPTEEEEKLAENALIKEGEEDKGITSENNSSQ